MSHLAFADDHRGYFLNHFDRPTQTAMVTFGECSGSHHDPIYVKQVEP
jgi:hypothetical protein